MTDDGLVSKFCRDDPPERGFNEHYELYREVKLTPFRGHLTVMKEGVLTFPRKPDSFELEVGRFLGLP